MKDKEPKRHLDPAADMVVFPLYTCTHIGCKDDCPDADEHKDAPYQLYGVDETTPCPDCHHPGTLVEIER